MRIRKIRINHWRHFQNVELQLDDVGLVCLVGANGTGKSHMLELIAACANRLGLSPGTEIPRGDPFSDQHSFILQFYLAQGVSEAIDIGLAGEPSFLQWDRTLTVDSYRSTQEHSTKVTAGGIQDQNQSTTFADKIVNTLRRSEEVYFLSLDGDRAYPKKNVNDHEVAQAYATDWGGPEFTRGRSFRPSTTLYDEWIKFFLALEVQTSNRHTLEIRRARSLGTNEPSYLDPFDDYRVALKKVLPHLVFTAVDTTKRTILFDTTGVELTFNQLSGGEREVAFLIGQIDRFRLREGLFLLDEPELHLNSDLIRAWVAYLTGTVRTGQIWLATHSLEAVEATGQQATFVLERDEETRIVTSIARLDTRPVLATLSRAVGTPAFSISQLVFVFVEGKEAIGERERFRKLAGLQQNIRFIECGSSSEVLRRVEAIWALAEETDTGIRLGGIVDRDFRSNADALALNSERRVFVLSVHEVENFFLHPQTLDLLLRQNGCDDLNSLDVIRRASDERAGSWIFQYAMATPNAKALSGITESTKQRVKAMSWQGFDENPAATIRRIVNTSGYDTTRQNDFEKILAISIKAYERKREETSLWKHCEGKQVLNDVARATGFNGVPAMIQAVFAAWERDSALVPDEVRELRAYVAEL